VVNGTQSIEFNCLDKDGTPIICTKERWEHITIASKHTELIDKQNLVALVIKTPDQINKDRNFSDRKVIYKSLVLPPPLGACYVRVVVKYRRNVLRKAGWVCSAFASEDIRSGEVIIWKK
jgi:hypothetical protein